MCWIIYTFQTFILYAEVHILCCACHLNLVRVFQENTWHLQYLWAVENRAAPCQRGVQCPMWAHVSLKVPLSPVLLPSGITWDSADMLMLPGNLWTEQPLHRNAQFFFLFASHTVLQLNMLNQLCSRWLQLNCLHKSCWKYLDESHLGLFWAKWREFRIGCSCISFWQALDDNVLENKLK